MGIFLDRDSLPWKVPVWFMRQAGRYHSHYQNLKSSHSFMELCKDPRLAKEVTMGPMDAFGFDGAILFSDLLFPLEQLGLGLEYSPGPKLARYFDGKMDPSLPPTFAARDFYRFQAQALTLIRRDLPREKSLLGFVGGPFTLYAYAVEGGHSGALVKAKTGLYNGLYQKFLELLLPELEQNMLIQAGGGADALCLFDTAAGELSLKDFKRFILPSLRMLAEKFKQKFPHKPIIYYSKYTHLDYLLSIECSDIDVLGFDWRVDLASAFKHLSKDYYLQGNFDPCWLHLPWEQCRENMQAMLEEVDESYWEKWILGLGHGVLVGTPEDHVRKIVKFIHHYFAKS